jgi:hypothetical protein
MDRANVTYFAPSEVSRTHTGESLQMKNIVLILIIFTLVLGAAAADKSVSVSAPTTLNGKTITPGEYQLVYDIKGNTADLKLTQSGKTIATATGQVVELKDAAPYNSLVDQTNADGTRNIIEIQFAKQKKAIRLNAEGSTSAVGK